jgi:hypothetical protein
MDVKFEDIQKANETIKTTDIKGKEYAEVNQRIKAFRMVYPTGMINTKLISNENGICIFRAEVGYINEDKQIYVLGTGTAYEKENSTFINKTSYIENCETSAVGRALGMAGFGIDTSVASAEEVENAILQQESEKVISKTQAEALQTAIQNAMLDINGTDKEILQKYGYKEVEQIKIKDYGNIVNEFKKIKGE